MGILKTAYHVIPYYLQEMKIPYQIFGSILGKPDGKQIPTRSCSGKVLAIIGNVGAVTANKQMTVMNAMASKTKRALSSILFLSYRAYTIMWDSSM